MENKNNFDNEEEDEETILRRLIDETCKKIEDTKKIITKRNEELKKEIEIGIKYEQIVIEKKEEIKKIEESIKMINERIGETHVDKKFVDALKNRNYSNEDFIYETLVFIKNAENNPDSQNWIKDWEVINSDKILRTEKLKMMKFLGHFFENAEKLFDIDNITFNNIQHKIDKIFSKGQENRDSPDVKVTNCINIKIFLREELTNDELDKKLIDLNNNEYFVFNISIIDYDYLYQVTNKYNMVAIKSLACKYFSLDEDSHLLVNEEIHIWPYDIYIYDEIFQLNLEKEYIKHHSKFFQFNPLITEGLKFIIIHKKSMQMHCMSSLYNFKFVENSSISKNCKLIFY